MKKLKRLAVLYSHLSGYMASCLKSLKRKYNVELLVYAEPVTENAPFKKGTFEFIDYLHTKNESISKKDMINEINEFDPHALLLSGWMDEIDLEIARKMKKRGVPVIAGCDNQENGSLRQWFGSLIAPWYLHSAIDVLWVPGDRQRQLANKLGYSGKYCWGGYYSCDWPHFAQEKKSRWNQSPRSFVYVGKYLRSKGFVDLINGYKQYLKRVENPWNLRCAGSGNQSSLIIDQPNIIDEGFVQPANLPALLSNCDAFVFPSLRDPWGVAIQEAAAVGLPLICTDRCGATVHLLQNRYNGLLVETGNVQHLCEAMVKMTKTSQEERSKMGERSFELSKQFTPERWSTTLIEGFKLIEEQ